MVTYGRFNCTIFSILFKKFLELEERESNASGAIENGIESKRDVPVVKLNRITAYWEKVICLLVLPLLKVRGTSALSLLAKEISLLSNLLIYDIPDVI